MKLRARLSLSFLGALLVPVSLPAQPTTGTPATTTTPAAPRIISPPPATAGTTTNAAREQPFTTFDNASPAVRNAVATAAASKEAAVSSLEEAVRLGIVTPATLATTAAAPLPPSVEALPAAVTRANHAILAESRATRASVLTPREAAITRLRQAQTEPERQRIVEELRVNSTQRLEAQREDARLVRDRIRQLRDLTTLNRPSGN